MSKESGTEGSGGRQGRLERRLKRERMARQEAERLLEEKSRELFDSYRRVEEQSAKLEDLVTRQSRSLSESEEALLALNRILLELSAEESPETNMRQLLEAAPGLFGAMGAFYWRLEGESYATLEEWKFPEQLTGDGRVRGCLVDEFLKEGEGRREIRTVLQADRSPYAATDPNIVKFGLKSFVGRLVEVGENVKGGLGLVFDRDREGAPHEVRILELLALALGGEEGRARTEEELELQEARFKMLFERSLDGILVHDWDGCIRDANPVALRELGYSLNELRKMRIDDLHPSRTNSLREGAMRSVSERGGALYEIDFSRRDGSIFPAEVHASSMVFSGEKLLQGIFRDITQRRRMEEQAASDARELERAKIAAEAANEAKTQFLANVSHEVRTPLNGIIGFTEILGESPLAPEQEKWVESIRSSGGTLLSMINEILDLSLIEQGELRLEMAQISPQSIVEHVRKVVGGQAESRGLEFRVDVAGGLPLTFSADEARLRQVLINLVGNAIKYTDQGWVEVGLSLNQRGIRFRVKDTGIGVPEESQDEVFETFQRGLGRERDGRGMGLAICSRLVREMGGELCLESEVGVGSTFWFDLPFDKDPDLATSQGASSISEEEPVWIIGSPGIARSLLRALLEGDGHSVSEKNEPVIEDDELENMRNGIIFIGSTFARSLGKVLVPNFATTVIYDDGREANLDSSSHDPTLPSAVAFLEAPFNREVIRLVFRGSEPQV